MPLPIGAHGARVRSSMRWLLRRRDERERQQRELSDLVRAEREASGEAATADEPPDTPRPTPRAQWDERRQTWIEWDDRRGGWVPVG